MSRVLSTLAQGERYEWGFESVTVVASLSKLARTVFLKTWDYVPGAVNRRCEVISSVDEPVFTGYLLDFKGNHTTGFTYFGTSLTHNLVMNDATNSLLLKKLPISQVLQAVCSRVSVPFDPFNTNFTTPVARFRVKRGQQYARALQDVAQTYRLVITDNGFGEASLLSITDDSAAPVRTFEAKRGAIQGEIQLEVKMTQLYSRYLVRGQRELIEDEVDSVGVSLVAGGIQGLTERNTTKVLPNKVTSTKLDAQQYAEWQAKMALSKAYRISFSTSDWDNDVGDIVNVIDDEKGIDEGFVIDSVRFIDASSTQEQSALSLTFPTAYSFRPLRKGTTQRTDTWQIKRRASRGLKVAL